MASGKNTLIAIISVGIGLSGLILNGQRTTNRAIEGLRSQVNQDMAEVRSDIGDLRERMARLEGRGDTLVDVFTDRESE